MNERFNLVSSVRGSENSHFIANISFMRTLQIPEIEKLNEYLIESFVS